MTDSGDETILRSMNADIFIFFALQLAAVLGTVLLLVAVDLIGRYFDVFWSALPRSLGLIGGGLLVLGIAYALERQRKRLLRRMAES